MTDKTEKGHYNNPRTTHFKLLIWMSCVDFNDLYWNLSNNKG